MIDQKSKIYIAGHKGLVGSAILRRLKSLGYKNLIIKDKSNLNLLDQNKVFNFLKKNKPNFIFIAAAKVGGILANNRYKADFIYQNLTIQNNLIHGAFLNNIKNLNESITNKLVNNYPDSEYVKKAKLILNN